jgi:sialic acid synthase SpsE
MYKNMVLSVMSGALFLSFGVALAADAAEGEPAKIQQTTGRQLMTPEEQNEQRTKMRNASSADERKELRKTHHEAMKEKAKEKGVAIPDNPPVRGQGMGAGQGGGMRGGR